MSPSTGCADATISQGVDECDAIAIVSFFGAPHDDVLSVANMDGGYNMRLPLSVLMYYQCVTKAEIFELLSATEGA